MSTRILPILTFIALLCVTGCGRSSSGGGDGGDGDDGIDSNVSAGDADADADSDTDADSDSDTDLPKDAWVPDETLLFTPPRGFYDGTVNLELSTNVVGGRIYYTLDGSIPSQTNGTEYTAPIAITTTSTVRAVVVVGDIPSTAIGTHTYIYIADVIRQGDERPDGPYVFWTTEMDPIVVNDPAYSGMIEGAFKSIATMSIVGNYEDIFGEAGIHRGNNLLEGSGGHAGDPDHPDWVEEVGISLEMFYPEDYPRETLDGFQTDCGLKGQGGGGRWDNGEYDHKQSFGLRFRTQYGNPSLDYPVFEDAPLNGDSEAGKYDKLILRAGHNKSWGATWDNEHSVYTRDQLGRDIQLRMSGIGARGTWVHLYINGLYWGLYNVTERPDDAHASNYYGGAEDEHFYWKAKEGDGDGDGTRFHYWLDNVVKDGDFSLLQEYLAVDEYIDVCLINIYSATGDFPQYYATHRFGAESGPIYFYNWDLEDAFGGDSRRSSDDPDVGIAEECDGFKEMWETYEAFRTRFVERVDRAVAPGGALSDERVLADWKALNDYIYQAIVCESARWGDERIDDTGERCTRDDQWSRARDLVTAGIEGRQDRLLEELRDNSLGGYSFYP